MSKTALQVRFGPCCHLHVQALEESVEVLVVGRAWELELSFRGEVLGWSAAGFNASSCMAVARKSNLVLELGMDVWNEFEKGESVNIQDELSNPSMGLWRPTLNAVALVEEDRKSNESVLVG